MDKNIVKVSIYEFFSNFVFADNYKRGSIRHT